MKKIILILLAICMLLMSVISASAVVVEEENRAGDVNEASPLSVQQTVIPSQSRASYGETITFSFVTTAQESTDSAIYVFERYYCPENKDCDRYGIYQDTWQSEEFSTEQDKSYETDYTLYVNEVLEKGDYRMVAYIYDRNSGEVITEKNDYGNFEVIGEGLTDSYCQNKYEGTCNSDIGIYENCEVSSTKTSCDCEVNSCGSFQICQDGSCVASNQCDPDVYSFSSKCDERTKNDCGGAVTRDTDGDSCGVGATCQNGECVKQCESGFIGMRICDGEDIVQTYKMSDCETEDRKIKTCGSGFICEDGSCEPESEDQVTEDQEGQVTPGEGTVVPEETCVVDGDCGHGFVCDSGDCVTESEIGSRQSNVGLTIVLVLLLVIVLGVWIYNIYISRKGKKKGKKKSKK